jgi:hypothetical protein
VEEPHEIHMPGWPTPEGKRCVTIELNVEHIQHLDDMASYYGMSRAAYLRTLIVRDVERQGPAPSAA